MRYNEIVLAYNVSIKRFPGNILASIFKFEDKDVYFKPEAKAKEVPKVDFN
jgi:LemA protein